MARMPSPARAVLAAAAIAGAAGAMPGGSRAAPQYRVEALTGDEAERGHAFAREFVRQLAVRRDVAPLVPDWFVRGFPERLVDVLTATDELSVDPRALLMFRLSPELINELAPDAVLEYYVEHVNFWYLANLRNISRLTPLELREVRTFDGALPVSVSALLYQNELLKGLLALPLGEVLTRDAGGLKPTIDTAEQLARGVDSLRLASERLRGEVTRPPAEASATYLEMQKTLAAAARMAAPGSLLGRATVCDAPCAGMPAGTRFLEISVLPNLHLHLLDVGRQLRVFFVDLPVI